MTSSENLNINLNHYNEIDKLNPDCIVEIFKKLKIHDRLIVEQGK